MLLEAAKQLVRGDLAGARDAFGRETTDEDSECAVAYAGLGAAELLSGNPAAARAQYARALVLAPSLPCANLGAGTVSCLEGDFAQAMRQYHAALVGGARTPATALAGEAHAACALGLYDAAAERARTALATVPDQSLARYVLAAAALARGDAGPAAELGGETVHRGWMLALPMELPSCLFSPNTAYGAAHAREHDAEGPGDSGSLAGPLEASGLFAITSPRPGQVLTGSVTVAVSAPAEPPLDYVIVLVNDAFAGVTSVRPYSVAVDTRLFAAGPAEIRADGYDSTGRVAWTAHVAARIAGGNRTLSPEERQVRQMVGDLLEEMALPPVTEPLMRQLAAHGLLAQGRAEAAVQALESAYSMDAGVPGLRTDLVIAYRRLGLSSGPEAAEVRSAVRGREVALTFDDGPHPLITPWILDQLDKEDVKATFFLVGKQVTLYPDLAREILRRGHVIGSHSYAHYSMRHLTEQECEQDLVKSRLALREACGETVTLFRPPGGYYDETVRRAVGTLGFTAVFWTANITSFPGVDGARIAAELGRRCADGGIILLHNGEDETLDTLPRLIPELRRRGVRFVTLSASDAGKPRLAGTPDRGG
jgi:peptidoglycan-N-acetylglucosamine deacetylase